MHLFAHSPTLTYAELCRLHSLRSPFILLFPVVVVAPAQVRRPLHATVSSRMGGRADDSSDYGSADESRRTGPQIPRFTSEARRRAFERRDMTSKDMRMKSKVDYGRSQLTYNTQKQTDEARNMWAGIARCRKELPSTVKQPPLNEAPNEEIVFRFFVTKIDLHAKVKINTERNKNPGEEVEGIGKAT